MLRKTIQVEGYLNLHSTVPMETKSINNAANVTDNIPRTVPSILFCSIALG